MWWENRGRTVPINFEGKMIETVSLDGDRGGGGNLWRLYWVKMNLLGGTVPRNVLTTGRST